MLHSILLIINFLKKIPCSIAGSFGWNPSWASKIYLLSLTRVTMPWTALSSPLFLQNATQPQTCQPLDTKKQTEYPKKIDFGKKNSTSTKTLQERRPRAQRKWEPVTFTKKEYAKWEKQEKGFKIISWHFQEILACIPPHTSRRAGDLDLILEKKFILVS